VGGVRFGTCAEEPALGGGDVTGDPEQPGFDLVIAQRVELGGERDDGAGHRGFLRTGCVG
jgi:hypothetical protein